MDQSQAPGTRPVDARPRNRAAVLRRLHIDGPCTRAVLATELGLNRSTIKSIVDGLAESGVVTEAIPMHHNGAGRPSLVVLPRPDSAAVLAIDIQMEQVAIAMVGLGGRVIGRHSWNLRRITRTPGEVITHVVESAEQLAKEFAIAGRGAGVSVPGLVRRADGWVHEASSMEWRNVALGSRLASMLGIPVEVANDAELGALAEYNRGIARGVANMVYISADRSVSGGAISTGQLRSTGGYSGALGHMVVRPGGRSCYCGSRGCWETEVGRAALCRALGLAEDVPRRAVVAELQSLATAPQPGPLDEFVEWLSTGLVTVVNMLAPELVVLGDLFAVLPRGLVDRVRMEVHERSLISRALGGTEIRTGKLGLDAKLVGASELVFESIVQVA